MCVRETRCRAGKGSGGRFWCTKETDAVKEKRPKVSRSVQRESFLPSDRQCGHGLTLFGSSLRTDWRDIREESKGYRKRGGGGGSGCSCYLAYFENRHKGSVGTSGASDSRQSPESREPTGCQKRKWRGSRGKREEGPNWVTGNRV